MGAKNQSINPILKLKHTYQYPHEHSKHIMTAVIIVCFLFISSDNMHSLIQKLDNNIKWWSMYVCLFGFFYFFSSPFFGKTITPSYSNFSRWYVGWIFIASLYHLPSFQSMGLDMRMNLSLFITIYISSVLFLIAFHIVFLGLWYFGLVTRLAGKKPEIFTIIQNCTVISIACCVFYSHCGNRALHRDKELIGRNNFNNNNSSNNSTSSIFSFLESEENAWVSNLGRINELKDQMCSSWLAPVGSASDYPLLSKWVIYGELVCNGPCGAPSDEISPLYSLWATFIGLYIANYIVERSTGWALTHPSSIQENDKSKKLNKPDFLDMVPWYSGTSADLFKTVFDLLVSVTLFVGRFDMRMMQAAMRKVPEEAKIDNLLHSHFKEKDEIWFDFMADTGDGGNSSYTIARLLAQPFIEIRAKNGALRSVLPRGDFLLIGGDLAYPNPSVFTYEKRFFTPFENALQPPKWYKSEHIAINKPEIPKGILELKDYKGPKCFIIPGNHDWFDGLHTFMRYICHKSWLGGWFLPQKESYFALQLSNNWWVFGLDLALHNDIDVYQFKFFVELSQNKIGEQDSVIIMTHEPNWLLDWYWKEKTGTNISHLIHDYLKGKCKVRIAGDLHHYMRHTASQNASEAGPTASTKTSEAGPKAFKNASEAGPTCVQHLIVNGCGGAFLHPTHVFRNFNVFNGTKYETKAAYPSYDDSSRIALRNILKFRKKNWQFDIIGGFIYFILVFSMFPQCNLVNILGEQSWWGRIRGFIITVINAWFYMLEHSYVSSTCSLILLIFSISFVPTKLSRRKRAVIGTIHAFVHMTSALVLMLLLELGIEICIRNHLLASSGYHTLYDWYRSMESEHFPDPTGLRVRMEQCTFGLYPACIKYLMSAFDVPEVMAVTRINICKNGMMSLSRSVSAIYYASVFIYFWVFSTPVVSLIFGSYLYICINWLHVHFDEAFSSLRIANYKAFTRFHVTKEGDLEVFTIAVDKVPKDWKLDPNWEAEEKLSDKMSHERKYPSMWTSNSSPDPTNSLKLIDHFVVNRTTKP